MEEPVRTDIPDDGYKRVAMTIASLGALIGTLNATALVIALPTLMVSLHTDLVGVMWVLISYMMLITILAPACGRLADMYGRRNLYIAGLAVFTFGSFLCGFAGDVGWLIAFRVLQAVGGAIMIANGVIIVVDAYPRHELGKAMGILSMIMAAMFVAGPIIGGFLTEIDWRLNFFVSVPVGIFATVYAWYRLREVHTFPAEESFDVRGMILFAIAFLTLTVYGSAGLLFGLLSPAMLLVLLTGVVSLWAFIRHQRTTPYPLIDFSLFGIRSFRYGQLSAFINAIARGAVMMLLILFFQGLKGFDPLTASILITPLAAGLVITGPLGGFLSDRYGTRLISTTGLAIALAGLLGLAFMQYDTPYWVIAVLMFVNGFGSGLFQPPNTSAIMASVPVARRGAASAMRAFFNNTGMVISMTLALPLLISIVPLDQMMNMFVIGGVNMPVDMQIVFTRGITTVFLLSSLLTVPAVIVSAMRGDDRVASG